MKAGTHLIILGNVLPLIASISFYFLLIGRYEHALITGIIGAIYGNLHTRYIIKKVKREIPQIVMSMLTIDLNIKKEGLEDLIRRVKK